MCEVLCSLAGPRPPRGPEPLEVLVGRSPALDATEEEVAELAVALRAALLPCLHAEAYRGALLQLRVSLQFATPPLLAHFPQVLRSAAEALVRGGVELLDTPEVRVLEGEGELAGSGGGRAADGPAGSGPVPSSPTGDSPPGNPRRLAVVVLPRLGKVATVLRAV